ncbi:unnamed protein product [Tilletia caries]|uniref:C2H2-type domain-containing protein n=1 Tax=Tilletia caries TaxID=13290 RepID=A0ABN7IV91_9BASI|nr:unnamed protein product [Tilletia caries]
MERIASAQWLRLQRAIGRAVIRIPPDAAAGRAICSSATSSARRSDAESSTAAAAHSAREARPAGMSAKAWGKQRQRSEAAPAVISELPSPYPESSAQIYSVADAELALRVLNRHCVLGTTQPDSAAAWPPVIDSGGQASTSASHRNDLDTAANQLQLISTFSRNVDVTLDMVSAALERILRDLGASHLVLDCANLVVRLAVRFRAQIESASSLRSRDRRRRPRFAAFRRRGSAYNKANSFRQIFHRLAHLIPHRPDRRNVKAAVNLLKSVVVLCNIPLKLAVLKNTNVWPPYSAVPAMRLSETRASNLPRKRTRRKALFGAELCRDVARALLDAPSQDEASAASPARQLGSLQPVTVPRQAWLVDDRGELASTSVCGLRSSKRPAFLSFTLARACVLAIHAVGLMKGRKGGRDRTFEDCHLCSEDYDAAVRALVLHGPETKHGINREHVMKRFLAIIKRTDREAATWSSLSRRSSITSAHSEPRTNPHQASRLAYYLHTLRKQAEASSVGDGHARRLAALLRRRIRAVIRDNAGPILGSRCPSLWSPDDTSEKQVVEIQHPEDSASDVGLDFLREALRALARDPKIPMDEVVELFRVHESSDADVGEGQHHSQALLRELQHDSRSVAQVIFGLTLRAKRGIAEWTAIDVVWNMAVDRRRSLTGSFDPISVAYLRSQKRRSEQAGPGGSRGAILIRALMQVWEQARLKAAFCTGEEEQQHRQVPTVSIRLATDIISEAGSSLGQTATALSFWQMLHRTDAETALAWRTFSAMLTTVAAAERTRLSQGMEGLPWRRSVAAPPLASGGPAMTGMLARQLFRRCLFQQHPALAPWSETAPRNPLEDVEAGGAEGMRSFSLFGSILLRAKVRGGRFFPWAQSITSGEQPGELLAPSLTAVDRQRPAYINFNAKLFEAYVMLLHTMTVPNSQLVQAATMQGSPVMSSGGSFFVDTVNADAVSQSGLQTPPSNPKTGITPHQDSAALEPPTQDELLLVLAWMRTLRVRPSRETLYILCIHLLETLPPGLVRPDQPAGPLTEWLQRWLGWMSVPSEDRVVMWLRGVKMRMRQSGNVWG